LRIGDKGLRQAAEAAVDDLIARDLDDDLFDITGIGDVVGPPRIVDAP
jgi:hypothetical protein